MATPSGQSPLRRSAAAKRCALAVSGRFAKLLQSIEPSSAEVARSQGHITSIRACLRKQFKISSSLWMGSHSKGTAIRAHSDLDLLVNLRREELRRGDGYVRSDTVLDWVRQSLNSRYPTTAVGRDQMAVVVNFGGGRYGVDVVPSMYWGHSADNYPLFAIPDGKGEWILTSPGAHGTYFRRQSARTRHRLRKVVQLLKLWAHARVQRIPLSSFHAEMVLAANGVAGSPGSYSSHLAEAFVLLASRNGAAFRDPIGVSGLIPAAATPAQREVLVQALTRDAALAVAALEAERSGNTDEAVRRWNQVFNGYFPK